MSILDIDEKFEEVTREYLLKKGFKEKYWGRSLHYWGDIYYAANVYCRVNGDDWEWNWGQYDPDWVPNKLVILRGGFREVCNINIKDTIDLDTVINQLNNFAKIEDDRKLYIEK